MGLKEEVLARIDLAEFVGQYVSLSSAGGSEYKGRCPFHEEKTASFHVNPDKQLFHCFGCKAGGNAIGFIERIENLEFRDALEWLARRYNIDIAKFSGDRSAPVGEKERLFRINEAALKFFREKLKSPEGQTARSYLAGRGVSERIAQEFDLGYAPREWQALTDVLLSQGFSAKEVERLGLIKPRAADAPANAGAWRDSFRHRLMFPIRSVTGAVIGFAGRALADEDTPKYLNVTNTPLYNKSAVLYNLDRAKGRMRDEGAVVVEGYMDVIGLASAGVENAVASCGTALTEGHVRLLSRYSDAFHLAFDGDEAGRRAAWGAGVLFLAAGYDARVVPLPGGIDPDELVRQRGVEAWRGLLAESVSVVRFWLEHQRSTHAEADLAEKRRWITQLAGLYARIPDPLVRDLLVQEAAGALGMGAAEVGGLLASSPVRIAPGRHSVQGPPTAERQTRGELEQRTREKALLQGASPTEREVVRRLISDDEFRLVYTMVDRRNWFADKLLGDIYTELLEGADPKVLMHDERYDSVFAELLAGEALVDDHEQLIRRHQNFHLQRRVDELVAQANSAGNSASEAELMQEIVRLKSQIREVRGIGGMKV